MAAKELPARPNLEQFKKQAKDLVKIFKAFRALKSGDSEAIQRVKKYHPRFAKLPDSEIASAKFALADAQLVIAREHNFESWPKFRKHIEALIRERTVASLDDPRAAFIEAACVPRDSGHASGTLENAKAILAGNPGVASSDIHTAAILGDEAGVRRSLALNPRNATVKGGPHGLGCPHTPLLLEISAFRSRAVERLRPGGDGAAGCGRERKHGVDGEESSTSSGMGERALRRRRSCAPRGADRPAARARRGPER